MPQLLFKELPSFSGLARLYLALIDAFIAVANWLCSLVVVICSPFLLKSLHLAWQVKQSALGGHRSSRMPMPTHINGRPVKTGSWLQEEDDLLAEWQSKLGNR